MTCAIMANACDISLMPDEQDALSESLLWPNGHLLTVIEIKRQAWSTVFFCVRNSLLVQ